MESLISCCLNFPLRRQPPRVSRIHSSSPPSLYKAGSALDQICPSSRSSRLLCHPGACLVLFHTYPLATVVRFILQRLRGLKAAQVRSRRRNWEMICSLPWLLFLTEEQLQCQEYVGEATSIQ